MIDDRILKAAKFCTTNDFCCELCPFDKERLNRKPIECAKMFAQFIIEHEKTTKLTDKQEGDENE